MGRNIVSDTVAVVTFGHGRNNIGHSGFFGRPTDKKVAPCTGKAEMRFCLAFDAQRHVKIFINILIAGGHRQRRRRKSYRRYCSGDDNQRK